MVINPFFTPTQAIAAFKSQYHDYRAALNTPFCLNQLFSGNNFNLNEYCSTFRPHLHARALKKLVEQFGQNYGIWLDNAADYITCHLYLFPTAHKFRMLPLLKNCAVDFFLNDVYGREVFHRLSAEKQHEALEISKRICEPKSLHAHARLIFPVEKANREMMNEIKATSPTEWFREFARIYNYHIQIAHNNCEATANGSIPTVQQYIDQRCDISGMNHTILLIEYAEGQFLNWKWLEDNGINSKLRRAQYLISAIGCLSNDLFSMEKEVIDNDSDSNLVMVVAMNDPELNFSEIIHKSAEIVGAMIQEFVELSESIRSQSYALLPRHRSSIDVLENHLNGLERFLQASWMWQIATKRYKRTDSVFEQTQLKQVVMA